MQKVLKDIKQQPEQSKTLLLGTNFDLAISGLREVVRNNIDDLNIPLHVIQIRYNLLEKLILPDDSNIANKAKEYVVKIQDLLEYENNVNNHYPNIGITSA